MNDLAIEQKIEAILFWRGESVSVKKLSQLLDVSEDIVKESIQRVSESLQDRGIVLIQKEDEVMLGTNPALSNLIEHLTKEELTRDLGKAGLETLSIVLYKGPIKRSEIDYIRGVNSNFILRNLLVRGLVEKVASPTDQRSYLYKPTFEALSYLGIAKIEELPEYEKTVEEVNAFVEEESTNE